MSDLATCDRILEKLQKLEQLTIEKTQTIKRLNDETLHQRWLIEDLEEKLGTKTMELEYKKEELEQTEQEKEDLFQQLKGKDTEIEQLQTKIRKQATELLIIKEKK